MTVVIERGTVSLAMYINVVRRPLAQLHGGNDCFRYDQPSGCSDHETSREMGWRRAERSRVRQLATKVQPADKAEQLAEGHTIPAEAAGKI